MEAILASSKSYMDEASKLASTEKLNRYLKNPNAKLMRLDSGEIAYKKPYMLRSTAFDLAHKAKSKANTEATAEYDAQVAIWVANKGDKTKSTKKPVKGKAWTEYDALCKQHQIAEDELKAESCEPSEFLAKVIAKNGTISDKLGRGSIPVQGASPEDSIFELESMFNAKIAKGTIFMDPLKEPDPIGSVSSLNQPPVGMVGYEALNKEYEFLKKENLELKRMLKNADKGGGGFKDPYSPKMFVCSQCEKAFNEDDPGLNKKSWASMAEDSSEDEYEATPMEIALRNKQGKGGKGGKNAPLPPQATPWTKKFKEFAKEEAPVKGDSTSTSKDQDEISTDDEEDAGKNPTPPE